MVGGPTHSDRLRTRVSEIGGVPLTRDLKWALAPGNISVSTRLTGLPKDSVANVSQILPVDQAILTERIGKLPRPKMEFPFSGIDLVLGK